MEALVQLVQSIYAVFGFSIQANAGDVLGILSIIYVLFASMTHFVIKEQPLANSKVRLEEKAGAAEESEDLQDLKPKLEEEKDEKSLKEVKEEKKEAKKPEPQPEEIREEKS